MAKLLSELIDIGIPSAIALAGLTSSPEAEASFGGLGAKMADEMMFNIAKKMKKEGMSPEEVFEKTRWFEGKDGKWRFEFDDDDAAIASGWRDALGKDDPAKLYEFYKNSGFMHNYPELFTEVTASLEKRPNVLGSYNRATQKMTMNPLQSDDEALKTILHEMQHGIQSKEKFSPGGSSSMFRDVVEETPGELARRPGIPNEIADFRGQLDDLYDDLFEAKRVLSDAKNSGNDMAVQAAENHLAGLRKQEQGIRDAIKALENEAPSVPTIRRRSVTAKEQYQRLYGEAEARNVEDRFKVRQFYGDVPNAARKKQQRHPHSTMKAGNKKLSVDELYDKPAQAPGWSAKEVAKVVRALDDIPASASAHSGLFNQGAAFLADSIKDAQKFARGPDGGLMTELVVPGDALRNMLEKWSRDESTTWTEKINAVLGF